MFTHPIIPYYPAVGLIVADDGVGKTALLCSITAAKSREGKRVLFIFGEGRREKLEAMLLAADADMSFIGLIDCVTVKENADVDLDGMPDHDSIARHLKGVDAILIDVLTNFASEGIKRRKIKKVMQPFNAMAASEGVTTLIAAHPNRSRSNLRKPAHAIPAGWAGSVDFAWLIEASDDKGHAVLEMVRGRDFPQPWDYYPFWVADKDGVKVAVIDVAGKNTGKRIADLLEEKNPKHLPPAVKAASEWLHDYLAEHGETLKNTIIEDGKEAGHAQPAIVQAKAISKATIGHTQAGNGQPASWFLFEKTESADSALRQVNQQNRRVEPPSIHEHAAGRCDTSGAPVGMVQPLAAAPKPKSGDYTRAKEAAKALGMRLDVGISSDKAAVWLAAGRELRGAGQQYYYKHDKPEIDAKVAAIRAKMAELAAPAPKSTRRCNGTEAADHSPQPVRLPLATKFDLLGWLAKGGTGPLTTRQRKVYEAHRDVIDAEHKQAEAARAKKAVNSPQACLARGELRVGRALGKKGRAYTLVDASGKEVYDVSVKSLKAWGVTPPAEPVRAVVTVSSQSPAPPLAEPQTNSDDAAEPSFLDLVDGR